MESRRPPRFVCLESENFEEFAHQTHAWNLDFLQLDRGPFRAGLLQLVSDSAHLGYARFNRTLDQRGAPPVGLRTFAILAAASTPVRWRHEDVPDNGVMAFPVDEEIDAISRPGFEVFTLSFAEEALEAIAVDAGLPGPADLLRRSEVPRCDPRAMHALRVWLQAFRSRVLAREPTLEGSRLREDLESELPRRLLVALASSRTLTERSSSGRRERALRRVKEYLEAFSDECPSVRDLCRVAEVSERTLQYAFLEHYGVPPKAYLRDYRLNRVRRELHRTESSTSTVSDSANRWGFWHMGQFAGDYRRLFGERPSETLARSGRASTYQ